MGFSMRGAVIAVCLCLVLASARGEQAVSAALRLTDVVAVAVRQSPELERARIDVLAARAQLLEAEGIEDTHVGARAEGTVIRAADRDPNGDLDQESLEASVSHPLSTGGTLSLVAGGDHSHIDAPVRFDSKGVPFTQELLQRYSALVQVGLRQPLLRGAGKPAFHAPIRQAARQRDAAALASEARARDLVVSLVQSYWQVAFAWRQLDVRKVSLELAQQQLDYTERAIRTEKVAPSEALAVQQAIAVRKQEVIAGEQEVYERSLALRQLGGLEIGPGAIAVRTEVLPPTIEAAELDVDAVVRQAFEHSAELASPPPTTRRRTGSISTSRRARWARRGPRARRCRARSRIRGFRSRRA